MRYIFAFVCLINYSCFAYSNPIDEDCPQLTYRSAPVVSSLNGIYVCHKLYAVVFSYDTKTPVYTTEHLTSDHIGDIRRTNDFKPDPSIPAEYKVTKADYTNSGYDRGHMTPAEDFSADITAMHESFFMSNMVPQNRINNQQGWKCMESKFQKWVKLHNDLYIITGPVYLGDKKLIGNGIAVPDKIFKVFIDPQTNNSITFYMDNAPVTCRYFINHISNLSEIEKTTGIEFDLSLNKEKTSTIDEW